MKKIGASRANLRVTIVVWIGPVAARDLDPRQESGRHVLRKTRIHPLDADIADGVVLVPMDVGVVAVIGTLVIARPIGHLQHQSPTPIEHALSAGFHEVRSDVLVVIVEVGGWLGRVEVYVLMHVFILKPHLASGPLRNQCFGIYLEDSTPAGAGPAQTGR